MMQSEKDFIKVVRENHQDFVRKQEDYRRYKIQREESKKMWHAKKIKKIKGQIIRIAAGVIVISSVLFYVNNNSSDKKIQNNTSIVVQTNDKEIQNNDSFVHISCEIQDNNKDINIESGIEQELIKQYCSGIYNVDYDVAYNIASKLTDNFKNEEYLKTNNPSFKINKKSGNNKEHGIILFLRHLSQKPEDLGVTKEQIKNKNFVSNIKGNEEVKVKHYANLFKIDPTLSLAIQYHETGRYTSNAYLNYNNPAGLMIDEYNLWQFDSPDAGIIEHMYQLKKNYIDLGYTTPSEIQKKYAPENVSNDPTNLNRFWKDSVEKIMIEIENNPNIFDNQESNNIKI